MNDVIYYDPRNDKLYIWDGASLKHGEALCLTNQVHVNFLIRHKILFRIGEL